MIWTTDNLCTGDCQCYCLCVILDIYRTRDPTCRTGVCYTCVRVELIICIPGPAFSSTAFLVPHFLVRNFPPQHFWSRIFSPAFLVPQTWHHWSRIFRSCIFQSSIFSAVVLLVKTFNKPEDDLAQIHVLAGQHSCHTAAAVWLSLVAGQQMTTGHPCTRSLHHYCTGYELSYKLFDLIPRSKIIRMQTRNNLRRNGKLTANN